MVCFGYKTTDHNSFGIMCGKIIINKKEPLGQLHPWKFLCHFERCLLFILEEQQILWRMSLLHELL